MTCTNDPCTCELNNPDSASALHFDADVVQCVHAALMDVLRDYSRPGEGHPSDEPNEFDLGQSAEVLLAEGITTWQPPARQEHRAEYWREACRRELKGYVSRAEVQP
jgi:hypothetical protein